MILVIIYYLNKIMYYMMNKNFVSKNPFKRILNAFKYSLNGFNEVYKNEVSFRQDLVIFVINIILIFCFCKNPYFQCWLFFSGLFILFSELVNSAIETLCDMHTKEFNPFIKLAKDIGSSLVLLSLFNLIISWFIFYINSNNS
jgi:diacylglycerol kinase (ATP)